VIRLGLTGGIASGKSTVCRMFALQHIPVFDADATVHRLYHTREAVAWFAKYFPEVMREGKVHRPSLLHAILAQPAILEMVENFIHPLVWQEERLFWKRTTRFGTVMTISDIPLLLEAGRAGEYDAVIVVTAPLWLRKQRALKRHGMSEEKFTHICAQQCDEHERLHHADSVIPTGAGKAETARQVHTIIRRILDASTYRI
jgi:dephospho-CoA kinase